MLDVDRLDRLAAPDCRSAVRAGGFMACSPSRRGRRARRLKNAKRQVRGASSSRR